MKICMPVSENQGLESMPYNHFGSAPFFMVYDTETQAINAINNGDLGHTHGMCQPIKALCGESIDAILVGGIGNGALMKLADIGIKAYHAQAVNFAENIKLYTTNQLLAFDASHVCTSHDCGSHH
ncbi:MAG: NifB/NifX family molybdenum-iron cluster-binding protein [Cellulosilyticaceae bacterium]